MWKHLHVQFPLFLSYLNETWIFSTDFRKISSNIKLHQNPCNGSRVVPCGRTDITKLIFAFRDFANAPKKYAQSPALPRTTSVNHKLSNYKCFQSPSPTPTNVLPNSPHSSDHIRPLQIFQHEVVNLMCTHHLLSLCCSRSQLLHASEQPGRRDCSGWHGYKPA